MIEQNLKNNYCQFFLNLSMHFKATVLIEKSFSAFSSKQANILPSVNSTILFSSMPFFLKADTVSYEFLYRQKKSLAVLFLTSAEALDQLYILSSSSKGLAGWKTKIKIEITMITTTQKICFFVQGIIILIFFNEKSLYFKNNTKIKQKFTKAHKISYLSILYFNQKGAVKRLPLVKPNKNLTSLLTLFKVSFKCLNALVRSGAYPSIKQFIIDNPINTQSAMTRCGGYKAVKIHHPTSYGRLTPRPHFLNEVQIFKQNLRGDYYV